MGVPFHVEARGDDDDDHMDSEDEHDEHGEERIFSQIDSNKFDIKGSLKQMLIHSLIKLIFPLEIVLMSI